MDPLLVGMGLMGLFVGLVVGSKVFVSISTGKGFPDHIEREGTITDKVTDNMDDTGEEFTLYKVQYDDGEAWFSEKDIIDRRSEE